MSAPSTSPLFHACLEALWVWFVAALVLLLLAGCAAFDPEPAQYDLNHGALADAIAAAKPGVPR